MNIQQPNLDANANLDQQDPLNKIYNQIRPFQFSSSPPIDQELHKLITLIIKDFVSSWFAAISDNSEFTDEIVRAIAHMIRESEHRLARIDWVALTSKDIPHAIQTHIRDYRSCCLKMGTAYAGGRSLEALFHGAQPHIALNDQASEREYLRRVSDILLDILLPDHEFKSDCVRYLLREILANNVLETIIDYISDPDSLNQIILRVLDQEEFDDTPSSEHPPHLDHPNDPSRQRRSSADNNHNHPIASDNEAIPGGTSDYDDPDFSTPSRRDASHGREGIATSDRVRIRDPRDAPNHHHRHHHHSRDADLDRDHSSLFRVKDINNPFSKSRRRKQSIVLSSSSNNPIVRFTMGRLEKMSNSIDKLRNLVGRGDDSFHPTLPSHDETGSKKLNGTLRRLQRRKQKTVEPDHEFEPKHYTNGSHGSSQTLPRRVHAGEPFRTATTVPARNNHRHQQQAAPTVNIIASQMDHKPNALTPRHLNTASDASSPRHLSYPATASSQNGSSVSPPHKSIPLLNDADPSSRDRSSQRPTTSLQPSSGSPTLVPRSPVTRHKPMGSNASPAVSPRTSLDDQDTTSHASRVQESLTSSPGSEGSPLLPSSPLRLCTTPNMNLDQDDQGDDADADDEHDGETDTDNENDDDRDDENTTRSSSPHRFDGTAGPEQHPITRLYHQLGDVWSVIMSLYRETRTGPWHLGPIDTTKYDRHRLEDPLLDLLNEIFETQTYPWWSIVQIMGFVKPVIDSVAGHIVNRAIIKSIYYLISEHQITSYLALIRVSMWPDRYPVSSPYTVRSDREKQETKSDMESQVLNLVTPILSHVIGQDQAESRTRFLINVFQNKCINKHLVFVVLDLILAHFAPEYAEPRMDSFLSSNPYFSAGFGLIGVTAGLALLRQGAVRGVDLARRRLLVSLEIPSKDHSYAWFLQWMSTQGSMSSAVAASANAAGRSAHTTAGSARNALHKPRGLVSWVLGGGRAHQLAVETTVERHENGSTSTAFRLVPGPGRHFVQFDGAWFLVERQRERAMVDLKSGSPWETVTVTGLSRDRALLLRMLEAAREAALADEDGRTIVYTARGHEWRPFGQPRRRRPLASVVLARGVSDALLADVRAFRGAGSWYFARGIPYRRGYLLHGPPGGGKTSLIVALAGELELNICVLNLAERGLSDDRLAHLLTNAPARSIILLEDIDAAFPARETLSEDLAGAADASTMSAAGSARAAAIAAAAARAQQIGIGNMLTLSGLLNALDGVAASEERLVFMTTNYPDRLDPALVRPGRVDVRIHIGNATSEQARAMFLRFYSDKFDLADKFVKTLEDAGLIGRASPAMLQGHFVMHREDPERAVSEAVRALQPSWSSDTTTFSS